MNVNSKHYILLLFSFAALAISGAGYVLLYKAVVSEARESSQAIAEVALENTKRLREQELTATYADTLSDRTRLASFVISEAEIVDFIEAVEGVGADSGAQVEISAIGKGDIAKTEKVSFGHIAAHLEIQGSWINVMRALILVENMPYSISMNNFNLVAMGDLAAASAPVKGAAPKVRQWKMSFDIKVLATN